jgi:hypothetical protein
MWRDFPNRAKSSRIGREVPINSLDVGTRRYPCRWRDAPPDGQSAADQIFLNLEGPRFGALALQAPLKAFPRTTRESQDCASCAARAAL